MSYYAIGDIHGRYDLFINALEKIKFNVKQDTLFILGDVVDGEKGAVPVIQYMMAHKDCVKFVMGNHDRGFLKYRVPSIKKIKEDEKLRNLVLEANKLCSKSSAKKYLRLLNDGKNIYKESEKLLKSTRNYRNLIEKELEIAEYLNFEKEKMEAVYDFLFAGFQTSSRSNIFCGLYEEMFELSDEEFESIVDFLKLQPYEYCFNYNEKSFFLVHYLRYKEVEGPDSKLANEYRMDLMPYVNHEFNFNYDYVLSGHYPVARLHSGVVIDFNYREIFSYIDKWGTHYYNLDLVETDILGVLRLDDMEEYYVTSRNEKTDDKYKIPNKSVKERKTGIVVFPDKSSDEKVVMVLKDYCWSNEWFYFDKKKSRIKFPIYTGYYKVVHKSSLENIVTEAKQIKVNKHIPYLQSKNPNTAKDMLLKLSGSDDINILKNLADNEGTPQNALLKLSKIKETFMAIAKNPSTSEVILLNMCDMYDSVTFVNAVLHNRNVNSDILLKLYKNENCFTLIAQNPMATEEILRDIYIKHNSDKLNRILLKHPNTPDEIKNEVKEKIDNKKNYNRELRKIASSQDTPIDKLEELASINNESIILAVAKNIKTPIKGLITVMNHYKHGSKKINESILKNPNINNDIYEHLLSGYSSIDTCPVEFCKIMLEDSKISTENIDDIYKKNKSQCVRLIIAKHPNSSMDLLKRFKDYKNVEIRDAALDNIS
ncbi:MAG: metallophosphoesterase [Clostridium sp.]|uniref:metallophosphoesterase n=1 Tax=Clostridium sp. TaxID=1506 RepID=UPI003D6D75CB